MNDEILEEVWRLRREYDQEIGGTLEGLFADLNRRQQTTSARVVDRSKRRRPLVSTKVAGKVAEAPADYGKDGK